MPEVKVYTIQQLAEIAATGSCTTAANEDKPVACADKTVAALADPSKFKKTHTRRARFTVRNTSDEAKYFGMGESMAKPGLTPLYPKSVFAGMEGVNEPGFFVGGLEIALAAGPNALALQAIQQWNPQAVVSAMAIVRVPETDAILAENLQYETLAALNGKCNASQVSPECNSCTGTTNSNLVTARYEIGLGASDTKNGWGLLIPGGGDQAPTYTIDVDFVYVVGAYGYVEANGSACN